MTRRTRQAIIAYWLSKHGYWRRASRFFFFAFSFLLFSSGIVSAEETATLISKESKPVAANAKAVSKKDTTKKAMVSKDTKEPAPKKSKFELPDVDPADDKAEGMTKYLRGTISARNLYGAAVVYDSDPVKGDLEMWATFKKSTKLSGYKTFTAIEVGDKVEIQYRLLKKTGKNILKEISLLEKKPKEEPKALGLGTSEVKKPAVVSNAKAVL